MEDKTEYKRISFDTMFVKMLDVIKLRSSCLKYKTSVIIAKDTQPICIGYNGTFHGDIECNDYWYEYWNNNIKSANNIQFNDWLLTSDFRTLHREWSLHNEIHAELNALSWISNHDNTNYTMYTYYSPCVLCAKEIVKYKPVLKTILYVELYPNSDESLKLFKKFNIVCKKINI